MSEYDPVAVEWEAGNSPDYDGEHLGSYHGLRWPTREFIYAAMWFPERKTYRVWAPAPNNPVGYDWTPETPLPAELTDDAHIKAYIQLMWRMS